MGDQATGELEGISKDEKRAICRKIERSLYRNNRLFLAAQVIGGFFPGLAVIGFIEAYKRSSFVRESPVITGLILAGVIVAIWMWKERYKENMINEELQRLSENGEIGGSPSE